MDYPSVYKTFPAGGSFNLLLEIQKT